MAKKHLYITLDTETCGGFGNPLVYDIGYVIHDNTGTIYEQRSYVVREIFYGEWKKMRSAYYANKLPKYREGIKSGKWNVASFWTIRKELYSLIKEYKIKAVIAYNAGFDCRALSCTLNYLSKFEEKQIFFNESIPVWDSWGMACQTILRQKRFFGQAVENNWVSQAGNVKTSAEISYRYIDNNSQFEESHTALEDALIEAVIFSKCIATKKKMNRTIQSMPWKIPQPDFKKFVEQLEKTA